MAMEYFPDFFGPRGMGEHRALSLVAGVTIPPKSRSILRFVADEPRSISNQLPARRRANDMSAEEAANRYDEWFFSRNRK